MTPKKPSTSPASNTVSKVSGMPVPKSPPSGERPSKKSAPGKNPPPSLTTKFAMSQSTASRPSGSQLNAMASLHPRKGLDPTAVVVSGVDNISACAGNWIARNRNSAKMAWKNGLPNVVSALRKGARVWGMALKLKVVVKPVVIGENSPDTCPCTDGLMILFTSDFCLAILLPTKKGPSNRGAFLCTIGK